MPASVQAPFGLASLRKEQSQLLVGALILQAEADQSSRQVLLKVVQECRTSRQAWAAALAVDLVKEAVLEQQRQAEAYLACCRSAVVEAGLAEVVSADSSDRLEDQWASDQAGRRHLGVEGP